MNRSPWWYEAKYEELQAKCNVYACIALIACLIAVSALGMIVVMWIG